jgi:hypothetical protein
MKKLKNALLIIGSPRGSKSTSETLGNYLLERLSEEGFITKKIYIHQLLLREKRKRELLSHIKNSDLIILSFPLYVDSLPSPVIRAMEYLSQNLSIDSKTPSEMKDFLAVCNSGFPESDQITTAIKICKNFSQKIGFQWLGGLRIGAGEAIQGRSLKESGKIVNNIIKGFDLAIKNIIKREKISQEAIDFASEILFPKKIYKFFGNMGWRFQALSYKNFRLKKKPYKK